MQLEKTKVFPWKRGETLVIFQSSRLILDRYVFSHIFVRSDRRVANKKLIWIRCSELLLSVA